MASMELPKLCESIVTLKGYLTHTLDLCNKFLVDPEDELPVAWSINSRKRSPKGMGCWRKLSSLLVALAMRKLKFKIEQLPPTRIGFPQSSPHCKKKLASLNQAASNLVLNASATPTAMLKQFDIHLLCLFLLMMERRICLLLHRIQSGTPSHLYTFGSASQWSFGHQSTSKSILDCMSAHLHWAQAACSYWRNPSGFCIQLSPNASSMRKPALRRESHS